MKRPLLGWAGFALALLAVVGCGPNDGDLLSTAEKKANIFLGALQSNDGGSAYGLLSKAYRERLPAEDQNMKVFQVKVFDGQGIQSFEIDSSGRELSPSKTQATFKGRLTGPQFRNVNLSPSASFTIILINEGGDWRVDLFTFKMN